MNENKKKLILFDIDGTLFDNKNKRIPLSTIKVLEEIHQTAIIGIATGRAEFMLYSIESIMHLLDYFVLINGQFIKAKEKVIYENPIEFNLLDKIVNDMKEMDIAYGFEGSQDEAISKIDDKVISSFGGLAINLPPIDKDYYKKKKVYQAWAFCTKEQAETLSLKNPHFQFIRWMEVGYDILPKKCSKGLGMKHLANYLKIDIEDVIAFGDGDNDFEMIRDAGIGVAMGNATEKVKSVANYITDSINEDGLYKAIKKLKIIH